MRAVCPAESIGLDFTSLTVFGDNQNYVTSNFPIIQLLLF
jgi:hypothetical protein